MNVPQIYVYILLDLFVEIYPTFCVITNYGPKNCYFSDFSIWPFLETNILLIILNINEKIQQNGKSPLLSLFPEFQPNRVVNFRGVAFSKRYTKNNKIQDGPKMAQHGPRVAQDGTKMAPKFRLEAAILSTVTQNNANRWTESFA